jgi:4-carboxymuconolactone decarboxylase
MPTRQELFQRGEAIRQQLQHRAHPPAGPSPTSSVPGVSRLTTEVAFGAVWSRPGLTIQQRMTCTLAVLSVLQRLPQLRTYINSALNIGMAPRTVQEIFIHCSIYGGFPTMVNALNLAREVFDARSITVPDPVLPDASLEELEAKGRALRLELQGVKGQSGYAGTTPHLAADLFAVALQYGYGEIWHRPDLDQPSRLMCGLAAFTALGGCEPQLRGFLQAARNTGFSQQQIVEILMQTAPYGGFPKALNALTIAQELFG